MIRILIFTSRTCGPCKKIKPEIKEWCKETGVVWDELDVEVNSDVARLNMVRSVPTIIVEKNGQEVDRVVGSDWKQIKKWSE